VSSPFGDLPNLPRGKGKYGIRNYLQTPVGGAGPVGPSESSAAFRAPLRLSEIKASVYGGLRFNRVLYAGWAFSPTIGMVAKDINKLGLELENFLEPLNAAVAYMTESIRRNFEEQGRPERWEPLSDYAVKIRHSSEPILVRSGRLKEVATSFSIWTITPTSASIRALPSFVWYGTLHQEGYGSLRWVAKALLKSTGNPANVNPKNIEKVTKRLQAGTLHPTDLAKETRFVIPERPFVVFQEPEDLEAIQEIFVQWMEAKADAVGRNWNRL